MKAAFKTSKYTYNLLFCKFNAIFEKKIRTKVAVL